MLSFNHASKISMLSFSNCVSPTASHMQLYISGTARIYFPSLVKSKRKRLPFLLSYRVFHVDKAANIINICTGKKRVESFWNHYVIEQYKSHMFDFNVQSHNDSIQRVLKSFIKSNF